MTAVNISGTFRKDERPYNGLEAIAKQLLDRDNAAATYVVVGVVRPHAIKWSADDGSETPTVRFGQIEVVGDEAVQAVKDLIGEAYRARTGRGEDPQDTLPFDDGPVSERPKDEWLDDKAGD